MKNVCRTLSAYENKFTFFLFFFLLSMFIVSAQTSITSVATSYIKATNGSSYTSNGASNSPLTGNTYSYKYGNQSGAANNNLALLSFTAGGVIYNPVAISNATVKMRRVDNAFVTGTRNLEFEEGTVDPSNNVLVANIYNDDMESAFKGFDDFNMGTDNLFANTNDANGNVNNIERLDVIFPNGTKASDNTKVGFAVFERGASGQHDPVKAALILSIDINGKPTSYSNIIAVTAASYGEVQGNKNYLVSRRDNATDAHLMVSTTLMQGIGGVFFKYSDFGIANNIKVYGYSLFCNDFTGNKTQAVDYANATFFPTDSDNGTGFGGIDLVAVTGIAESAPVLPINLSNFTVKQQGEQLLVQWIASMESEISNYTIEYSADGRSFNGIANAGSYNTNNEQYAVAVPVQADGTGYYRLKIAGINGEISYSPVVIVNSKMTGIAKLFPNPAKDAVNIAVTGALAGKIARLRIVTITGIPVYAKNIILSSSPLLLNINYLPAGNFVLEITTDTETINKPLSIVK